MRISINDFWAKVSVGTWEGYIWFVEDEKGPSIINETASSIFKPVTQNIYNRIQEANLFNGTESIHVKNVDGSELVFCLDTKNLTQGLSLGIEHVVPGAKSLKPLVFKNLYQDCSSEISGLGFSSNTCVAQIFIGFLK